MTEQRRGSGQGRPPAKRSGASGGQHARARRSRTGAGRARGRGRSRSGGRRRLELGIARRGAPGRQGWRPARPGDPGRPGRDRAPGHRWGLRALRRRPARRGDREKRGAKRPTNAARQRVRANARRCGPSASAPSTTRSRAAPGARRRPPPRPARRRKRGPADVQQEMAKVAGRNANRALGTLDGRGRRLRPRPRAGDAADPPAAARAAARFAQRPRARRPRAVPDRQLRRRGQGARGLRRPERLGRPEPRPHGLLPGPAPVAQGRGAVARAGRGVADRRARRRGPHRLRRRARRPGPAPRGARPAAQAGRAA